MKRKVVFSNTPCTDEMLISTLNNIYVCPKCKKVIRSRFVSNANGDEGRYEYFCDCRSYDYNFWKLRRPGVIEEGVTVDDEKGVISLYRLGSDYFIPRHAIKKVDDGGEAVYFRILNIDRISVNVKTGAAYFYTKSIGVNIMKRVEWTEQCSGGWNFNQKLEFVLEYIREALKAMNLPIACTFVQVEDGYVYLSFNDKERVKNYKKAFKFECGNSSVIISDAERAIEFVHGLVVAPNIAVRYDEYTGKAGFREDLGKKSGCLCWKTTEFKKVQPRVLTDEGRYINMLCEKLNIPNSPKLKKAFRKDPRVVGLAAYMRKMGFKKVDNLIKLCDGFATADRYCYYDCRELESFIKALVKNCGETNAANKLVDGAYLLSDTGMMWRKAIKHVADRKALLKGTMREIHDRLNVEEARIRKMEHDELMSKTICYTKAETDRTGTYDGYSVRLPENPIKLGDIGDAMHICVGSYGERAVSKACTIYYVVDQNEKYQACIEVRKNKLIQAKGYCNKSLEDGVAEAVKKWVEDTQLDHSECNDFECLLCNLTETKKVA